MRLNTLLNFKTIVIQCHDAPDADTLASGYGLYRYFKSHSKAVRLIYSGAFPIRKSNLLMMLDKLSIPIDFVSELDPPDLLITADCRCGQGNVRPFSANHTAVIDHHQGPMAALSPDLCEIRSSYGSCATIVWDMLKAENYDVNNDEALATALYYGLYMDTGQMQEIWHPMDKDMRDSLRYNKNILTHLSNCALSSEELKLAGSALSSHFTINSGKTGIVRVPPCDPNLLGIISDLLIKVDTLDTCIAYAVLESGVKFSVRSCTRDVRADEFAAFLADGFGSAGGHITKAGGFADKRLLPELTKRISRYLKEDAGQPPNQTACKQKDVSKKM